MIVYKFLARGARTPLSDDGWPTPSAETPGAWVTAAQHPFLSAQPGVHACRAGDLAHWLHDELWLAEAAGEHWDGIDCVLVERARLLCQVDEWQSDGALRFTRACAEHAAAYGAGPAAAQGYLADARSAGDAGYTAVSAHACALAATLARIASGDVSNEERAYREERAWQSAWIAEHVIANRGV